MNFKDILNIDFGSENYVSGIDWDEVNDFIRDSGNTRVGCYNLYYGLTKFLRSIEILDEDEVVETGVYFEYAEHRNSLDIRVYDAWYSIVYDESHYRDVYRDYVMDDGDYYADDLKYADLDDVLGYIDFDSVRDSYFENACDWIKDSWDEDHYINALKGFITEIDFDDEDEALEYAKENDLCDEDGEYDIDEVVKHYIEDNLDDLVEECARNEANEMTDDDLVWDLKNLDTTPRNLYDCGQFDFDSYMNDIADSRVEDTSLNEIVCDYCSDAFDCSDIKINNIYLSLIEWKSSNFSKSFR